MEFTAALRGLSVSHIMTSLSNTSNCEEDAGFPLLANLQLAAPPSRTNEDMEVQSEMLPQPTTPSPGDHNPATLTLQPKTLPTEGTTEEMVAQDIVEDQTIGDCILEEGLFYVAGWLVRMLQKDQAIQVCHHCEVLLLGSTLHDHSYASPQEHPFLEAKRFTPNANLMRPSTRFFNAVRDLEEAFGRNINTFWPKSGVRQNLEKTLEGTEAFKEFHRDHPEHALLIEEISIKKCTMCRLGAEIRIRNRGLSAINEKKVAEKKVSTFTS
ncbi:uncharacterized protein LOC134876619 isoform X1 [Eleginops maclovinus]